MNHLLETVVDSTKTRSITPVISIDDFLDSLQLYNLEQAPFYLSIKNSFAAPMDGNAQTIELADKYNYRKIIYSCPPYPPERLRNFHNSMMQLFSFLRRNLKVKFVPC